MRALSEISQMSPFPQITTYHGSPYLFGRLDPSKVGTGEGAQAYGVGAGYISEGRPVAESYRASVAAQKQRAGENMGEVTIGGKPIDWGKPEEVAAFELARHAGDRKAAADFHARTFLGGEDNPAVKLLRSDKELLKADMPGYLYKGDIPDEIIPQFLDWDKPLSQQTPEVRSALEKLGIKVDDKKVKGYTDALLSALEGTGSTNLPKQPLDLSGESIYKKLGSKEMASKKLEKVGIRGIRYLDQGSRGSGEGTSNFIPFGSEDFRIEEINDQPIADWVRSGRLQVDPNDPLAQFLKGK
jgi:hypothetical protein